MSKCDRCVTDKNLCVDCSDNPIYANVPKWSHFSLYIPTCPRGYKDCVGDPAYIKTFHPKWYKKIYGDLSPQEASLKSCKLKVKEDPYEEYYCYDDEDK